MEESVNDISSSEYLYSFHGVKQQSPHHFDLDTEFQSATGCENLIRKRSD